MSINPQFPGFPFKAPTLPSRRPVFRLPLATRRQIETLPPADVVAVLAHPDDETFMNGTLTRLIQSGYSVQFVYATSGDQGKNLLSTTGRATPQLREQELAESLKTLKLRRPPVMLHYPDAYTGEYQSPITDDLKTILEKTQPKLVLSFGPDGMTGHPDHINVGRYVDNAVAATPGRASLYHMALTPEAVATADYNWPLQVSPDLANGQAPDVAVDISGVNHIKHNAQRKYPSQFTPWEMEHRHAWYAVNHYENFVKA